MRWQENGSLLEENIQEKNKLSSVIYLMENYTKKLLEDTERNVKSDKNLSK